MNNNYAETVFNDDEDLFFEHVIQEDFDLLLVDVLLRQMSINKES